MKGRKRLLTESEHDMLGEQIAVEHFWEEFGIHSFSKVFTPKRSKV
jgi:hypothetical protein